jgi:SAM-dependent methyltransferase
VKKLAIRFFNLLRIDIAKLKYLLRRGFYYEDLKELKYQKGNDETFYFGKEFPVLDERNAESGVMRGHYFHQDLHVAQRIFLNNPSLHLDIGSRIDGFVAHVAVFRSIEVLDIRSQDNLVENVFFKQADLTQLPSGMVNYCDSISSLHAIEHFGLGRYGDPIDYFGYLKAIENIHTILKSGGRFYFSVPIGPQRIEFNAHRVFAIKYLIEILAGFFEIENFSYVDDNGDLHKNMELNDELIELNFNCNYGCGIFELIKK